MCDYFLFFFGGGRRRLLLLWLLMLQVQNCVVIAKRGVHRDSKNLCTPPPPPPPLVFHHPRSNNKSKLQTETEKYDIILPTPLFPSISFLIYLLMLFIHIFFCLFLPRTTFSFGMLVQSQTLKLRRKFAFVFSILCFLILLV